MRHLLKRIGQIIIIIIVLYCICILVGNLLMYLFINSLEVTNPKSYSDIYNKKVHVYKNLLNHFPANIPDNAKDVKFYYFPGFLQGGMVIKLEFKASKEEIESYINKYKDKSSHIYNPTISTDYGKPSTYGIDLNETRGDVQLYILNNTGPQNHGHLAFIAVNDEHTEILFQAERW